MLSHDLVSLISFIHTHKTNASSPGIISKLKARRRKKGYVSSELVSPIYQKALGLPVIQQTADYIPLSRTVSRDHPNMQGCLGRCHFHSFSSRGRQGVGVQRESQLLFCEFTRPHPHQAEGEQFGDLAKPLCPRWTPLTAF